MSKSIDLAMSSPTSRKCGYPRDKVKSFVIVWLDEPTDVHRQRANILEKLQTVVSTIELFTDLDQCLDYLTDLTDVHVLFLLTAPIDRWILSEVLNLRSVSTVYVLRSGNEEPSLSSCQVKTFDGNLEKLTKSISANLRRWEDELVQFEVSTLSELNSSWSNNPNNQDFAFLYSILLRDVLLKFDDDSTAEMAAYCRTIYRDNQFQRNLIDEFERSYTAEQAIRWYTEETFLFRIVNAALRTRDAKALYSMRTYIRHLHEQLAGLNSLPRNQDLLSQSLRLYRGQRISHAEMQNVRDKVGGLMSFPSFLSTSANEGIARLFAGESTEDSAAVVMEIIVDGAMMMENAFGCIEQFSPFAESEEEWLFSMDAVFRIEQLEYRQQTWEMRLRLTNDQDENINKFLGHIRKNIHLSRPNPLVSLCRLFARLGEYDKAVEICQNHLDSDGGWEIQATLCDTLALMHAEENYQDQLILQYHQQALENMTAHVDVDHPILASYYSNLAISLSAANQHEEAVKAYRRSIEVELKDAQPDYVSIAYSYDCMATLLQYNLENDELALEYSKEALKLMSIHLPAKHEDLLSLYASIADLYEAKDQHEEALELLYECLKRRETPPESSARDRAFIYRRIAEIYRKQKNFRKASEMMAKSEKLDAEDPSPCQIDWNKLDIETVWNTIFNGKP